MTTRTVLITDTMETWFTAYNNLATDLGDASTLDTTSKILVGALNELHGEHDALDTRVGPLATLYDDIEGASIVASINLLSDRVGDLTSMDVAYRGLDVTQSVEAFYDAYVLWTGSGTALDTTATNLAAAVNEVHGDYDGLNAWVGTRTLTFSGGVISATSIQEGIQDVWEDYYSFLGRGVALTTTATTITGAINEIEANHNALDTRVGPLTDIHIDIRDATSVAQSLDTFYDAYLAWAAPGTAFGTTAQTATGAVNELHGEHDALDTRVGALSSIAVAVRGADVATSVDNVYDTYVSFVAPGTALTTAAGTVTGAINEIEANHNALDTRVGALSSIALDVRGADFAASINLVDTKFEGQVGTLSSLTTAAKTNVVAAVNELQSEITSNDNDIATINSNLGNKGSIDINLDSTTFVTAINSLEAEIGMDATPSTTATTVWGAINEIHDERDSLDTRVGSLAALDAGFTGANDDSIVAAINYLYSLETGATQNFTNAVLTGTLDVGGLSTLSGGLTVDGGNVTMTSGFFTTRGINDDATVERLTLTDSLVTVGTALTASGDITSSGNVTGGSFRAGQEGSIHNTAGEGVYFSQAGNSVAIQTGATNRILVDLSSVTIYEPVTLVGGGLTVPTGHTVTINGSEVFHPGNMGSTSGLDADLIDGVQLTQLARTDVSETFTQNVVINGNLTVLGTTTSTGTDDLLVADNKVVLNSNVTGTPTLNAFYEVERGSSANTSVRWNEASNIWDLTNDGTNFYEILTTNSSLAWANVTGTPTTLADYGITDAAALSHTHAAGDITSGTFANARVAQSNVTQHQAALSIAASQLTGTLANARVAQSNVTQHQAALSIAWSQLTSVPSTFTPSAHTHSTADITSGTFADARVAQSNVTQHQAALSIGATQLTGTLNNARLATTTIPARSTDLGAAQNLNDYQTAGFYHQTSNANAGTGSNYPVAQAGSLVVQNAAGVTQQYYTYNDGSPEFYFRAFYNTSWSGWLKVWHSGNDGAGSGLDADTLDGTHLSGLALASHTHSTSDITSGTFADARVAQSNVTQHQAALALGASQTTSGTFATARIPNLDASKITSGTFGVARIPTLGIEKIDSTDLITGVETWLSDDVHLATTSAIANYVSDQGFITGVTAGNGLTGGGSSGAVTLNIGAGTGITVAADSISVNMSAFSTTNLSEGTNLYFTNSRADARVNALVTKSFVDALAVDAGTLDGIDSSAFLRSNTADTATGKITFNAGARFNDNDIIELGSSADAELFHNGSHTYLDLNLGNLYVRDGTTTRFTFDDNGDFTATGDVTGFSDSRLKTLESQILNSGEIIDNVLAYYYRWNDKAKAIGLDDERKRAGVMANDVEKHYPEALARDTEGKEEYKKVNYEAFIPVLLAEVKALRERVAELEEANGSTNNA